MGEFVGSRLALRIAAPIVATAFLVGATVSMSSGVAQAKKAFSEETGFPCKKCHNDPAGGKEEGWTPFGQKWKAKNVK